MLPVGPAPLFIAAVAGGLLVWKSEIPLAVALVWTLALLVLAAGGLPGQLSVTLDAHSNFQICSGDVPPTM